jgi:hypothetical protein
MTVGVDTSRSPIDSFPSLIALNTWHSAESTDFILPTLVDSSLYHCNQDQQGEVKTILTLIRVSGPRTGLNILERG